MPEATRSQDSTLSTQRTDTRRVDTQHTDTRRVDTQHTDIQCVEIAGHAGSATEPDVHAKYECLTKALISKGWTITTMESCTCGQVASLITDTEGSSAVLKGAFVTYSNEAKVMQGVPEETLEAYGVYSPQTAAAMAEACRAAYCADFGVGVTGSFANADPNNPDSLPGEVFFAIARGAGTECFHCSIPAQASRWLYKLYMADVIANELLTMIS